MHFWPATALATPSHSTLYPAYCCCQAAANTALLAPRDRAPVVTTVLHLQMFSNCRRYNAKDTPIAKLGIQLSDAFERQWTLSGLEGKCRQEDLLQQKEAAVSALLLAPDAHAQQAAGGADVQVGLLFLSVHASSVHFTCDTLALHQKGRPCATIAWDRVKCGVRAQGSKALVTEPSQHHTPL